MEQQSEALSEWQARYQSLLNASFDAIAVHDAGRLLETNPAFERMFGCGSPDAVGRPVLDFFPQESHPTVVEHWRQGLEGPIQTQGRRKDGAVFPLEMVSRSLPYQGRDLQVCLLRDLSDQKAAEEQRVRLLVEKQRVTVMHRFVSDASHDLRTPLTNLKTSCYLARRLAHDPEKQNHHLEVIEAQTARMEHLLEELLTISRLDAAATGEFHFGPVDLNAMIPELLDRHQVMATSRNHTVEFIPGSGIGQVLSDSDKLPIALASLLTNAHTYTPSGGRISVRTYRDGDKAAIEVTDTGIGIAAADLDRIFDSFYRTDRARSLDSDGAGLGLAIAKRIIEMHGGKIAVESAPDQGSRFTIFLPCYGKPAGPAQGDSGAAQPPA